jgi:acetyltransferase
MGGNDIAAGEAILNRADIPTYPYPDTAARVFGAMWRYSDNLRALYETPVASDELDASVAARHNATSLIEGIRKTGRTILTEFESKELLAMYGIPTVITKIATTEEDAVKSANEIGYPIVLKLFSETITHKTDVGGVVLNLKNADEIRKAFNNIKTSVTEKVGAQHFQGVTVQKMIKLEGYEIILGSSIDPQFGPVLLFGLGGQLVEVFKDKALGLPPLNTTLARRMLEQTRIFHALKGVRGRKPVDLAALERLMVRFSQVVAEQRWIKEIDINPLLASPEQIIALDARVILHEPTVTEDQLPKLAIRPYPVSYVSPWKTKDGVPLTIRPIRPEDEPLMVKFHETLTERSVYFRYFSKLNLTERVAHDRLIRICFNDYDRQIALVAEQKDASGSKAILGVGRLSKAHASDTGEFAVVVSDQHHKQGLGTELTRQIIQVARAEKLKRICASFMPENQEMRTLCERLGFKVFQPEGSPLIVAEMTF